MVILPVLHEHRTLAGSVLGFGSLVLRLYIKFIHDVQRVYQRGAVKKVVPVSPSNVALVHETYLLRLFRG